MGALFSPTPPFEKPRGFAGGCPLRFDTVAWIQNPPGAAYGHSVLLQPLSQSRRFFSSFHLSSPPPFLCSHLSSSWNGWKKQSGRTLAKTKRSAAFYSPAPEGGVAQICQLRVRAGTPVAFMALWSVTGTCGASLSSPTHPVNANMTGGEVSVRSN